MLDRKFIIANLEAVRDNCRIRKVNVDLDALPSLDERYRTLSSDLESVNQESKAHAKSLSDLKGKPDEAALHQGRELKNRKSQIESELRVLDQEILSIQTAIPNMTDPRAPIGDDDTANEEIERGKTPVPQFDFPAKDHVALADELSLVDFEGGSRVAGHGFYFLRGAAVRLELALQQFALDVLENEGFTIFSTPELAKLNVLTGTGYNPRDTESNSYTLANNELGLIATSEIPLAGLHMDAIFDSEDLPLFLGGISHCFRTEAGAYGRAGRGLYRVHQFSKVEMFAYTRPDQSSDVHMKLRAIEQHIFDSLEVPYRVVENATGDLGNAAYRKFDLEAWMPGKGDGGDWGEITSASNCTDYQSRRLGIRYRDAGSNKVAGFAHTLNGTAISSARAIISILENNQQPDGSVRIPKALQPWMNSDTISAK